MGRKRVSSKKLRDMWNQAEHKEGVKAFRQTFGYDYEGSVEDELDLMDRDVKKAKQKRLKELARNLGHRVD